MHYSLYPRWFEVSAPWCQSDPSRDWNRGTSAWLSRHDGMWYLYPQVKAVEERYSSETGDVKGDRRNTKPSEHSWEMPGHFVAKLTDRLHLSETQTHIHTFNGGACVCDCKHRFVGRWMIWKNFDSSCLVCVSECLQRCMSEWFCVCVCVYALVLEWSHMCVCVPPANCFVWAKSKATHGSFQRSDTLSEILKAFVCYKWEMSSQPTVVNLSVTPFF